MAVSAVLQFALSVMFTLAGLFALAVIVSTWRKAAPAIAALGRDIALLEHSQHPRREVRFRIAATGGFAVSAQAIPARLRIASVRKPFGRTFAPITGLRAAA